MNGHTTPVSPSTQPKVHRVRHCPGCGQHLTGIDRLYGRCGACRTGDTTPHARDIPREDEKPVTCRRCNRPLRDPASVAAGIGPTCAAKEGEAPMPTQWSFDVHGQAEGAVA